MHPTNSPVRKNKNRNSICIKNIKYDEHLAMKVVYPL